ncbi:MAG: hypothetical protein ACRDVZ_04115 [Jiangellaceae bacterium]
MPSYRVTLRIDHVLPGHTPPDVLNAACAAVRAITELEHSDVVVSHGEARIVVRFVAVDDVDARSVGRAVESAVLEVATAGALALLRRSRGTWTPL